MMPLAPTPIVAVPAKPKIGFSIDSIVGSNENQNQNQNQKTSLSVNSSPRSDSMSRTPSPMDDRIRVNSSPESHRSSRSVSPTLDPGRSPPPVIRPSALPPGHVPGFQKGLWPEPLVHPGHHILAAAAAQHFQQQLLNNGSFPAHPPTSGAPALMPSSHHPSHPPPRDTYPLYPWLLSRHGRIFPHRFPGGLRRELLGSILGKFHFPGIGNFPLRSHTSC
ncbi:unnamed protein product [Bemisia tabaci]|uniref:Empty spiracles n=1 Tax=Bemisia tabaci TaxID=7038 RepID=A0A9P0APS5_BEMTA|nr:unnamed protein product [Bemisia tabaci]